MATRKRKSSITETPSPFPFSYEQFEEWYAQLEATQLEPVRLTFTRLLNEWLDKELGDLDRYRMQISSSRVKSATRAWSKMQREKYRGKIADLCHIPDVLDDLVGIRITCHNNCDVRALREMLAGLPSGDDEEYQWINIESESEKRYVDEPKQSGYRAYHINLKTLLQTPQGWKAIRAELQVRTLLQDGWGELTHEDTYKPGFVLPPLASKLARRMADLLAAVDDLAQDLRDELDRLAQESISEDLGEVSAPEIVNTGTRQGEPEWSPQTRQALLAETRNVVSGLTKGATLAEVAQRVRSNFGPEVVGSWAGFGTFRAVVQEAVPGATIVSSPPGFVYPPGHSVPDEMMYSLGEDGGDLDGVPRIVRRLRQYDTKIPICSSERLGFLMNAVTGALTDQVWGALGISSNDLGIRELNQLSRFVRDGAVDRGEPVRRHNVDYVLKGLLFSGNLRIGLDRVVVDEIAAAVIFSRASRLGLVTNAAEERAELEQWFASAR